MEDRTYTLDRTRRRVAAGMTGVLGGLVLWMFSPGLPMLWAPRASAKVKAAGLDLFVHEWQPHDAKAAGGDGLGPVFNGRSCVECHFQGGVGGGGGNKFNVTAFEAMPTQDRPTVEGGLIHKFAVANHLLEDQGALRKLFPTIPDGIREVSGCSILTRDFDPVRTDSVNSTALFGAGWIDRLPSKSITHNSLKADLVRIGRELQADFNGVRPGRYRVLPDGRVGKFGWKAQFATLEEFVAAACANEIGLGNPRMPQAKPLGTLEYPDVDPDLDSRQFSNLVAFVDTLPRPVEDLPEDEDRLAAVERGREVFREVGCAVCHVPDLGGVTGVYSDFLLYNLEDRTQGGGSYGTVESPEAPLPLHHPKPEEWKTPPLWGVADSAPYFHDGGSSTLEAAILRHRGDAEPMTQAFKGLSRDDRLAVLAFLKTLKAPADAHHAQSPGAEVALAR